MGEKAQFLVHKYNDNTIRFVLDYPGPIDPDLLCAAVRALVERLDVLHASFLPGTLGARWHVNKEYEESNFFRLVETPGDPGPVAQSLALLPIDPGSKAQFLCTLVCGPETSSLAVCISHLCVDGGDGKYLLGKLAEAYRLLQATGTAAGLEVKNGSRAAEQVYRELNSKEFLSLWKLPLPSVNSPFPFPDDRPGLLRLTQTVIPAPVMAQARQKAKLSGSTANDLLLAALCQVCGALPGVASAAPVSVTTMMDLRRHCRDGESEGLCNMSGRIPLLLEHGPAPAFEDTLSQITAQTRAAKADPVAGLYGMPILHGAVRALPMGLLALAAGRLYGSMSLGLTNLGSLPRSSLALGELLPTGGLFGGPLKKKPAMQVSAMSLDNACSLTVVGQYTQEDTSLLQSVLDAMAECLVSYVGPF